MKNFKINAQNAPQFTKHLGIISKLADVDYPYPFDLFYELRRLENRANRICTLDCNGDIDSDKASKQLQSIKDKVCKLLPNMPQDAFFINGDPRGYTLKLKESYAKELDIYTDYGRHGIIAPEF